MKKQTVKGESRFGQLVVLGLLLLVSGLLVAVLLLWRWQNEAASSTTTLSIDPYPEWLQAMDIQFGEGVELLAGDWQTSTPNLSTEAFGDVTVDYMNLKLTLADGRVIDLPMTMEFASNPQAMVLNGNLLWYLPHRYAIFVIDLETGTISNAETVDTPCGELNNLDTWVLKRIEEQDYFCEVATGELVGPIVFDNPQAVFDSQRFMSPDERILAVNVDDTGVLLFNTESREWQIVSDAYLPYLPSPESRMDWIEGSRYLFIMCWNQGNRNLGQGSGKIIDIDAAEVIYSQAAIVEDDGNRIEMRLNYLPYLEENPLRLIADYADYDENSLDETHYTHCFADVFYLESREQERVDYGALCNFKTGDLHGIGYFLEEISVLDPATTSYRREEFREGTMALLRHDANTGQNEVIYAGAIEDVVGVSPNERYAILRLSLDDNVLVAFEPMWGPSEYRARFVVIDLDTGEIFHEHQSTWQDYPISSWSESAEYIDLSLSNQAWFFRNIFVSPNEYISGFFDGSNAMSLPATATSMDDLGEGWFAARFSLEDERSSIQLLNANGENQPLLSFNNPNYSSIRSSYLAGREFLVTIESHSPQVLYNQSYVFTLRVNGD